MHRLGKLERRQKATRVNEQTRVFLNNSGAKKQAVELSLFPAAPPQHLALTPHPAVKTGPANSPGRFAGQLE